MPIPTPSPRPTQVALLHDVPLTLLGFGDEYRGNYQKLRGARAHLATLPRRTLVLFADAYDVLYAADGAALRRRYDELAVPPDKARAPRRPRARARARARTRTRCKGVDGPILGQRAVEQIKGVRVCCNH